jgi:hypothetical protein
MYVGEAYNCTHTKENGLRRQSCVAMTVDVAIQAITERVALVLKKLWLAGRVACDSHGVHVKAAPCRATRNDVASAGVPSSMHQPQHSHI